MWTSMLKHYWLTTSKHFQYQTQICFGLNKLNTTARNIYHEQFNWFQNIKINRDKHSRISKNFNLK